MEQYGSLLDFESMPVLALTVSVISDALVDDFIMEADWNRLLKNQTVYFDFYKGYSDELQFEELSGLTVWCSYDSGLNWYDITGLSNVKLGQTLSVRLPIKEFTPQEAGDTHSRWNKKTGLILHLFPPR